jgi:hypothetical protein
MENPNTKGAVAEQAIVLAAIKLNVPVLRPGSTVPSTSHWTLARACGAFR